MPDTVTVSTDALRQLLNAAVGPGHYMRELQATREPAALFADNPINILVRQFNDQVAPVSNGDAG